VLRMLLIDSGYLVRPVRRSLGPIKGSAARPAGGETDSMTEVISTGDPVLPCARGRVAMFPWNRRIPTRDACAG